MLISNQAQTKFPSPIKNENNNFPVVKLFPNITALECCGNLSETLSTKAVFLKF